MRVAMLVDFGSVNRIRLAVNANGQIAAAAFNPEIALAARSLNGLFFNFFLVLRLNKKCAEQQYENDYFLHN